MLSRTLIVRHCLVLALAALTLAACGSSDTGSSDAGSENASNQGSGAASGQLSRAQLIAEADKICGDTAERIKAQGAPTSLSDVERFSAENARVSDEAVAKLKALTPPDSVKADYDAFVERTAMAAQQARDVAEAAKTNDPAKVMAASEKLAGDVESRTLARKIGFKVCRSGPASPVPPGASAPDMPQPASP